uniref:Uncharacterized protein n=1 Tax=Picea sitchensis TaxID=3332 RepID=D5AC22_PICSI|nr:unknown [Picea sitchensis]ADE77877.1 unknown [Picea sitchensis]
MSQISGSSSSSRRDRRGPVLALPGSSNANDGIIARMSNSVRQSLVFHKSKRAASNTARFSKKVLWSTGKAAWIAGTTFLVLVVPLIIEMDREQQLTDLEIQQASLLGAPPVPPKL